jgi:curli biogenesis system outer membrane secretion channel CsgG
MKPLALIPVALLVISTASAAASAQDSPAPSRPIVTIAQFETGRTGWVPPPGFGETIAELLGQRLVAAGQYRVLDSEYLTRDISGEPGGGVTLEVLRERAAHAGVRYLVLGSLTQFSREQRQRSGGGAAVLGMLVAARFHAPIAPVIGGGRSSSTESILSLAVRMIDVQTGEIVATAVGQGTASRTNRSAMALGIVHGAPLAGGLSSASHGANDAMLGEAVQDALDELADALARAAARLK